MVEVTFEEQNKVKRTEDSLRDVWDNIKHNIWIIRVPEKEDKEEGQKKGMRKFLKRL